MFEYGFLLYSSYDVVDIFSLFLMFLSENSDFAVSWFNDFVLPFWEFVSANIVLVQ